MPKLNIKIYRNLMGANDLWAARTRALLKKRQVVMLNLIGSPGAGADPSANYSFTRSDALQIRDSITNKR